MRENLLPALFKGTAPLLLWALHFALCYGLVAAQCSPALAQAGGPSRTPLLLLTAVTLGGCLLMLPRHWPARLLDWATAGSAVLALVGIGWTSVPLLLLDGCYLTAAADVAGIGAAAVTAGGVPDAATGATRQMTLPTSSATSSAPALSTATPTGRP